MQSSEEKLPPRAKALFKKGKEIFDVVHRIGELIGDDNRILLNIKGMMYRDAMMLTAKVAGAEGGDLYDVRMENAAFIRNAAMNLKIQNHSLREFGFEHVEYFNIVRDLIEEYRLLFIDWVASFDQWNYSIDCWGLFNPPGVGPFDKDPEDDIPFIPDDFFED